MNPNVFLGLHLPSKNTLDHLSHIPTRQYGVVYFIQLTSILTPLTCSLSDKGLHSL